MLHAAVNLPDTYYTIGGSYQYRNKMVYRTAHCTAQLPWSAFFATRCEAPLTWRRGINWNRCVTWMSRWSVSVRLRITDWAALECLDQWEVPGSILNTETGYPDWFSYPGKLWHNDQRKVHIITDLNSARTQKHNAHRIFKKIGRLMT